MATQPKTSGLTYEDLRSFPDDNLRREIIDGELFVTPSPMRRHQREVARLTKALVAYEEVHGGETYPAPMDVFFSDTNVLEPDVLFLRRESLPLTDPEKIAAVPDLVVEVSSPSTRRRDLTLKKDLYERFGVGEYWFVDIEAERVEAYRLQEGRYGPPEILRSADVLTSPVLPDFAFDLSTILEPDRGLVDGIVSSQVLREAERNLRRKLPAALPIFLALVGAACRRVDDPPGAYVAALHRQADPKDLPVLAAALQASCGWLLTFNTKDFRPASDRVRVAQPGAFIDALRRMLEELAQ